jgi:hypothetical protein
MDTIIVRDQNQHGNLITYQNKKMKSGGHLETGAQRAKVIFYFPEE